MSNVYKDSQKKTIYFEFPVKTLIPVFTCHICTLYKYSRYLRSTFSVVLKHFKPDILVYLGDLMDEGSVSSMGQFHGYVKRLADIFDVYYPVVVRKISQNNKPIYLLKLVLKILNSVLNDEDRSLSHSSIQMKRTIHLIN